MASTAIKSIGKSGAISQSGTPYQICEVVRIRQGNKTSGEYSDRIFIETSKSETIELDISEGVTVDGVVFSGTTEELIDALGAVFFKASGTGEPTSLDMGTITA